MTRYAAENFSLRQENRQLRSLETVVKAEEAAATVGAELEEIFQRVMETERLTESKISSEKRTSKCSISYICVLFNNIVLLQQPLQPLWLEIVSRQRQVRG